MTLRRMYPSAVPLKLRYCIAALRAPSSPGLSRGLHGKGLATTIQRLSSFRLGRFDCRRISRSRLAPTAASLKRFRFRDILPHRFLCHSVFTLLYYCTSRALSRGKKPNIPPFRVNSSLKAAHLRRSGVCSGFSGVWRRACLKFAVFSPEFRLASECFRLVRSVSFDEKRGGLRTFSQARLVIFSFRSSRWPRPGAWSPRRWTARPAASDRSGQRAA